MPDSINRFALPIHDRNHVGLSPNVLIILLHDATSVSDDYTPQISRFTGSVNWVQLDQGADDSSHLISPEDRLRVAMVRQ